MVFFEVFDNVSVGQDLRKLFEEVEIERVIASKNHERLKIYIKSRRLITYQNLKIMEYQMKKQLFTGTPVCLSFIVKYELSESYTPEKLMPIYFDSIVDELREESILDANIFQNAEWSFEADKLILSCEENFVIRERSGNIKELLEVVFNERCGFGISVVFQYHEVVHEEKEERYVFTDRKSVV